MKRLTLITAILLTIGTMFNGYAQQKGQSSVPHAFKYQAVARDNNGQAIANQNVSFRISVLMGDASTAIVYQEIQTATTNQFGLANLSIGKGNVVSGNFDDVQWGGGNYYLKVEFDSKGGNDYVSMGTSQLLSVPYAMYSERSDYTDNIPQQVALIATNVPQPLTTPPTGMLVYNTATSGTAPYDVTPGLYYNAGTSLMPDWTIIGARIRSANSATNRALASGTNNTTFGGQPQNGVGCVAGNETNSSCPAGSNNTAFGDNTFGGNISINPTGDENTAIGAKTMFSITTGNRNTASGFEAEYNTTSGSWNTADGDSALYKNTSGYANTGTGYDVLHNNTANRNTADGYEALYFSTTGSSNTAVGTYGVDNNTTGSWNTGVGDSVLATNKTGSKNTAVGYQAIGAGANSINDNTAIGYKSLYNNTADNNTAVGGIALLANTTGSSNVAVGSGTLQANTTGGNNSGLGAGALADNTSGSFNTASGEDALDNNTTASYGTADGYFALAYNTTGAHNTASGARALQSNLTGSSNTATGYDALYTPTAGSFNTANGDSALYSNNTGTYNTANGYQSMMTNTSGNRNAANGSFSLRYNTTGSYGTADGYEALYSNTTGAFNTGVGDGAAVFTTTGSSNTAIGNMALRNNVSGSWNTAIGDSALYNNNSYNGYYNTALGYQATLSSCGVGTIYNSTVLGAHATACESNNLVLGAKGSNSVHVCIGVSYTNAALDIADGNTSDANINCHIKTEGSAPTGSVIGTWATSVTLTSNSTDTRGNFTINVASVPASWSAVKVSFNKTYGSAPYVVLTSANATAGGSTLYYVDQSATTATDFTVYIRAANGGSGSDPSYNYIVIE